MWYREHSVVVKTTKEAVWAMWTNPENWPKYDSSISEAAFHGDLTVGVEGKMKASSGDKVVGFSITELVENERMTVQVKKFGARVLGIHMVDDAEDGVKITFRVELRGIFSWFHRSSVKKGIGGGVEKLAEAMATTALECAKEKPDAKKKATDEQPPADADAPAEAPVEGDPAENEKRKKDMHDQIEEAAEAEVPEVTKPEKLVEEKPEGEEKAEEAPAETEEAAKEEAPAEDPPAEENPENDAPKPEVDAPKEDAPKEGAPAEEEARAKEEAPATDEKAEEKPSEDAPAEDAAPATEEKEAESAEKEAESKEK